MAPTEIQFFLEQHQISNADWEELSSSHKDIDDIISNYIEIQEELEQSANNLSSIIQKMQAVHSVRWRVKTPSSLFYKIYRKKKNKIEKYFSVNRENYREILTDLVGIRAIHLFKNEFISIHKEIISTWDEAEPPKAYVRRGDIDGHENIYKELKLKTEEHNFGYRSVHYIMQSNPTKQKLIFEIQVRTIFEEGWSEVDHKIRYPDFSDNSLILNFLNIFNRISGAADEMASFVNILSCELKENENRQSALNQEILKKDAEIDKKLSELERANSENSDARIKVLELMKMEENRRQQQRELTSLNHPGVPSSIFTTHTDQYNSLTRALLHGQTIGNSFLPPTPPPSLGSPLSLGVQNPSSNVGHHWLVAGPKKDP